MVKLRVNVGAKRLLLKVIREKLGIKPGKILLVDEKNGKNRD